LLQANKIFAVKWYIRIPLKFKYEFKVHKEIANDVVHHLEYNAERSHLIIPEYGRHLQKLIDQATAIEDTEERNKAAKYIIQVMGSLNPHLRDVLDFQHKLWDQLFLCLILN
jgi:hypothetical protein